MSAAPQQRTTRQRTAVVEALSRAPGFRSAQQLHDDLRAGGASVGLTTVYRHLQALAEAGAVDVLHAGDGEARYRACPTEEHHHHVVCRSCGRSAEISGETVERWAEAMAAEHGFSDVTHTVEVYGTCADCRRTSAATA
ncbi:MAG TPA: Fur family transcriptional regulator [Mycobacteriales bacterium]|nr:Fur family transcriptional regulator [Mycobacteriales bacterium]